MTITIGMNMQTAVAKGIAKIHKGDTYIVGGTLLPHETRDLDLLLYHHGMNINDILKMWGPNYTLMGFDTCKIYPSHLAAEIGECSPSAVGDDSMVVIVKLTKGTYDIHLLYVSEDVSSDMDVVQFMYKYFPLSAQEIAFNVRTHEVIGSPDLTIIVCKKNSEKAKKKYQGYYPDAIFIDTVEEVEDKDCCVCGGVPIEKIVPGKLPSYVCTICNKNKL